MSYLKKSEGSYILLLHLRDQHSMYLVSPDYTIEELYYLHTVSHICDSP